MNEQAMLRRRIEAAKFAAWEMHLFLDSHPNNCEAAKRLEGYRQNVQKLTDEYEKKYGPLFLTSRDASRWEWISSPWPWETEEQSNVDL